MSLHRETWLMLVLCTLGGLAACKLGGLVACTPTQPPVRSEAGDAWTAATVTPGFDAAVRP